MVFGGGQIRSSARLPTRAPAGAVLKRTYRHGSGLVTHVAISRPARVIVNALNRLIFARHALSDLMILAEKAMFSSGRTPQDQAC